MKCRFQVSPLWKNPAANGPWYQVESNPVIPVDNFVFASAAKWAAAPMATSSAIKVGTRDVSPAGGDDGGSPPPGGEVPSETGPAGRSTRVPAPRTPTNTR